MTAMMMEA